MLALLNPTSIVQSSGYVAIFALSVAQSCCVPTSSELTLGFAGVLAAEGKLSLPGVIAVGVLGELVGAFIAWAIGRSAGRAVVDRYGKYILLSHRDLDRAEEWYSRHQRWGVFGSRLLPVIRNFVALPAGIAEVPLVRFGILTFLGSLIWDSAMALIGYGVGGRWRTVMKGFNDAGYVLGALVVAAIAVFIWHRYRSYKAATSGDELSGRPGQQVSGAASRRVLSSSEVAGGGASGVPAREAGTRSSQRSPVVTSAALRVAATTVPPPATRRPPSSVRIIESSAAPPSPPPGPHGEETAPQPGDDMADPARDTR